MQMSRCVEWVRSPASPVFRIIRKATARLNMTLAVGGTLNTRCADNLLQTPNEGFLETGLFKPSTRENLTSLHANNKCVDKHVHPYSLNSVFVISHRKRMIQTRYMQHFNILTSFCS